MPSSNFVDFIHSASRIGLGQNVKALVWRWRQICPLKTNIFTLNAPISTNKVSMFKLAIEVCSENHYKSTTTNTVPITADTKLKENIYMKWMR